MNASPSLEWGEMAVIALVALALVAMWHRVVQHRAHLTIALDNMTQGLLLFDETQRVIFCNQRYIDLYGVSPAIVKPGCTLREVIEHRKALGSIVGDVQQYCNRVMQDLAVGGKPFLLHLEDGRSFQIIDRPIKGGGWVSTHEDITSRRRLEERIIRLAHYDEMTDLPNRSLFVSLLQQQFDTNRSGFALLYVDLDRFKVVNDSYGHDVGDHLLRSVAARLKDALPASGIAARLGGDEFAAILPHESTRDDILNVIQRIQSRFAQPFTHSASSFPIEASIGVAIGQADGHSVDELIKSADVAMYDAKMAGRNTYCFYEPGLSSRLSNRRVLRR